MRHNVYIIEAPIPEQDGEAWALVHAILERRDDEADLPVAPVFVALVERLAALYPCISCSEHRVMVLRMTPLQAEEGLPVVVDAANALGLVVFDEQGGRIFRPPPASRYLRGRGADPCEVRLAGIRPGFSEAQVVASLAPLFKRSEEDVRRLLAQKNPLVKKNVSRDAAAKYVAALERSGAACVVESENDREPDPDPAAECRRMAEAGDAQAQFDYGTAFFEAKGTARDWRQGMAWWLKSAEQGNAAAQYHLACLYSLGEDVPKDMTQALAFARKSAEQGMHEAQFFLGYCYEGREGVEAQTEEAIGWYTRAAEQGNAKAQFRLGVLVKDLAGENRGAAAALRWFRLAAAQNHAAAQYNLGVFYGKGIGAPADPAKSMRWHRRAAILGNADSQRIVANRSGG
jgi:TPR repeat protein